MFKKLLKKIEFWSKISIIKTLYLNFKYGYFKNKQLIIYPKTKIQIHPSAHIELRKGHFICNFSHFGKRFRRFYSTVCLKENSSLILYENNFTLCEGASILVGPNASLILKGKGYLNTNSNIECYSKIEIGEGTIISYNVSISDSDIHHVFVNGQEKINTKPIIIGNNVWIGKNSIIHKGVQIGNNSIIAAASVVVSNVPENCIVGGNPSKIIKENTHWEF
jgi:acetyltransferase-like isoleucine patch superfamily enzyme